MIRSDDYERESLCRTAPRELLFAVRLLYTLDSLGRCNLRTHRSAWRAMLGFGCRKQGRVQKVKQGGALDSH